MKKLLFVACLLCSLNGVMAQGYEFKPFRVDAGLGYGMPLEKSLDAGVLFYLEPKYAVTNQISLGLRAEGALFAGIQSNGDTDADVTAKVNLGYLLTGDYYFTNNTFRPFVGLGLGFYETGGGSLNSQQVTTDDPVTIPVETKTNFGAMLRAGFDVTHFRFTVSYNYGGKILDETHQYLGISIGFYIGGGKK